MFITEAIDASYIIDTTSLTNSSHLMSLLLFLPYCIGQVHSQGNNDGKHVTLKAMHLLLHQAMQCLLWTSDVNVCVDEHEREYIIFDQVSTVVSGCGNSLWSNKCPSL